MVVAAQCVPVTSSWVSQFVLTCDNELAVQFRNNVCCLYPMTNAALFQIAISWPSPGKFVHQFLYKRLPYRLIKPPCPAQPCGGVTTACCPADPVPTALHATFTGAGSLDGTYALTYDSTISEPTWTTANAFTCTEVPSPLIFACKTFGSAWLATIGSHGYSPAGGSTCSPLVQRFTGVDLSACVGPTGATITVTT